MNQVVSEEMCQQIKLSSAELYMTHPAALDPKILQACIKLNRLSGIAVRWSCEGHYPIRGDNRSVEIVVVVTQKGMEVLEAIYNLLKSRITPDPLLQRCDLGLLVHDLLMFEVDYAWHPNWRLTYTLPLVEVDETDIYFAVQEAYIGYLEAAIDSVAHALEGA